MDERCPTEEELCLKFAAWRKTKVYKHQKIPDDLLALARSYAKVHGHYRAAKAARLSTDAILGKIRKRSKSELKVSQSTSGSHPAYSKIEVNYCRTVTPIEFESPLGFKLRINEINSASKAAVAYFFEVTKQ
jgi:hypothetical protein